MVRLNVNIDSLANYADKLIELHRSALPVAIRTALNSAAFDVKQHTMPDAAKNVFTQRKPNFFKANSKVETAKGFDVGNMQAIVGFKPLGQNKAVDNLEQQEHGGEIGGRSLIPMDPARVAGSQQRLVKANARLSAIRGTKAINADRVNTKSRKQKFIRAAIKAKELNPDNAFVLGNKEKGRQTLSRIDRITLNRKDGTIKIKRTPLYTYSPKGKIKVARTNFMKRASHESGLRIERYFVNEAIKQFKKYTTT